MKNSKSRKVTFLLNLVKVLVLSRLQLQYTAIEGNITSLRRDGSIDRIKGQRNRKPEDRKCSNQSQQTMNNTVLNLIFIPAFSFFLGYLAFEPYMGLEPNYSV